MSTNSNSQVLQDPPLAKLLFSDTRLAWLWLPIRLYVGWQWLQAAQHKFIDPKWMQSGEALKTFWVKAIAVPDAPARPAISYAWYRSFLTFMVDGGHHVWFAKLVVFGEGAIGIALILGAFVGVAAFFGAFMNWNFIMAGSTSSNPMLLVMGILLILAWKTAGWIGLDRFLLPMLGTPWSRGAVFPHAQVGSELEAPSPLSS